MLGGDDGEQCTYDQGYMARQAVFACLTCTPALYAGFCTACSLKCHEGHEVRIDTVISLPKQTDLGSPGLYE